jgi:glucose/arabinose dehydrogenase
MLAATMLSVVFSHAAHAFPAGFVNTQIIGSGLDSASGFEFAPDGRIFILQRTGAIKIYKNNQLLPTPFYTFSSVAEGDRGLIGIAFDPAFATNHYVYFYYTGTDLFNHLVRFDASNDTAPDNGTELYTTHVPSNQLHVGGSIRFGPDGKMYFAVGDNGYPPNAQDLSVPYGKILRINKDGTIPSDNPFVGQSGALPEIWAYGLRNPWRFQFDSATGNIYGGDVGNDTWEEINHLEKGKNYGWPLSEGFCMLNCTGLTDPMYDYNHNGASAAVTGGPVYHASQFPAEYQGKYFFGDYAQGNIRYGTLDPANNQLTNVQTFEQYAGSVVDLKVAPDGSLYYITYIPARLYKVAFTNGNQAPVVSASADKLKGVAPLTVNFSSAGSNDPEGVPLTYKWDLGDGTTSTDPNPVKTYTHNGTYTITLTVSDGVTDSQSVPMVLQVGLPPTVRIGEPTDGTKYNAGDTIHYTAFAQDGAGFDMNDAHIVTKVILHHQTHTHPFIDSMIGRTNTFVIPNTGEPSAETWYEIDTTATDDNGLATTASVNIYPNVVPITLTSNIVGMPVGLDGQPRIAPYNINGVTGFQRELEASEYYTLNGVNYHFLNWSDGGARVHTVTTPAAAVTYTANYEVSTVAPPEVTGSFETTEADGKPVGIQGYGWGTNTTSLTLSSDAHEGLHSGRIDMSGYVTGEARWFLDPINVNGGQTYTYRQWYKSNQTTKMVADVTMTDGSHQYIWLGYLDPAADWTKAEYNIVMPAGAKSVIVSQYLYSNGWLEVDGLIWGNTTTTPPVNPPVDQPTGPNLIANPEVATIAPDTNAPTGWTRGSWGTNTPTFSWTGLGRTDANGLGLALAGYTNGQAKWISNSMTVDATKTYLLTYWYKSTITHTATLDITMSDGTHQYMWLGDMPASADWKQNASQQLTLPTGAASARLEMSIATNGSVTMDGFNFGTVATTAPPDTSNLIANPTIATIAPDTNAPSDWTEGSWGTNTTTYSWTGQGRTDANGLKVEMTGYVNGQAKWLSKSMTMDPTKTYNLSYWYRSTVTHNATLDVTLADGTHQYIWLGDLPVSSDWKQQTNTIANLPATAQSARLVLTIQGNGWLNTDDFSLTASAGTTTPPPTGSNLIANPTVATIAPDTNAPSDWTEGSWGTNTPAFSWAGQGRTDANGLRIDLSNYTNGQAKWISKAATVDPSKTYTLSYWYRSTLSHTATLDVTLADGTHQYVWLGNLAASAGWTQQSLTVANLPATAQSVRLELTIQGNGWLNTDDFSLM